MPQQIPTFFANLWLEASVVAIVCSVFLLLFVAAGIREILNREK